MGERESTFDALVEAMARELWRIGNERIGDRPWETVAEHYLAEAAGALNVALALVSSGGGTLTETECEHRCPRCKSPSPGLHPRTVCLHPWHAWKRSTEPCPTCSGSGRQWQIGKLVEVHEAPASGRVRRHLAFVPRSEGDGT